MNDKLQQSVVARKGSDTRCPFCNSDRIVRAGKRRLVGGHRQMWRCHDCLRRFSTSNKTGKHTEASAVLETLILTCRNYSLEDILTVLSRRYRINRTKSTLSRWIGEYRPPYLDIREKTTPPGGRVVRSWLFTHRKLNYLYQLHTGKIRFATPFNRLRTYLESVPTSLDHRIFDTARHCSGMTIVTNPGLRRYAYSSMNMDVLHAVTMAQSRRQRHQTVEDYLLNCDRNTVATEVPVWYDDRHLGLVAGHIDVLQINYGRVHILDYKPDAAKENPAKVATQLTLYAIALAVQAGLHLHQIRCAYFDEKDLFLFEPHKPAREEIRAFLCEEGSLAHSDGAGSGDTISDSANRFALSEHSQCCNCHAHRPQKKGSL